MNEQDRRETKAYQNLRTAEHWEERERMFHTHHQFGTTPTPARQSNEKQVQELFCSCNGLKCDGICRVTHLYRPRYANPTAKKSTDVKKMWAEKCPEAYEKDKHYRT